MAETDAFQSKVARMSDLSMTMAAAGQRVEKRSAVSVLQSSLNMQGAVVKSVEFAHVAKHGIVMHLAFDKSKLTP